MTPTVLIVGVLWIFWVAPHLGVLALPVALLIWAGETVLRAPGVRREREAFALAATRQAEHKRYMTERHKKQRDEQAEYERRSRDNDWVGAKFYEKPSGRCGIIVKQHEWMTGYVTIKWPDGSTSEQFGYIGNYYSP